MDIFHINLFHNIAVLKDLKREKEKLRVEQREIEIEYGIYYSETE